MESAIVSKEQLDAYMADHSQKLVSEIRNGDTASASDFSLIMVGVRIYMHETDKEWSARQLMYENNGWKVDRFNRWKWYFIYLRSLYQVETPRRLVTMEVYSYVATNRDEVLLKVLRNKLIAAKRERTKTQMAIERAAEGRTSLFGIENDPGYIDALAVLEKK